MDSSSCEIIPDTRFSYGDSPIDRPFIRLLTLLPERASEGAADPLKCLLTTHIWDPETGFISHSGTNLRKLCLIGQETVKQEIGHLTEQCPSGKSCTCLTYEALSYQWGDSQPRFDINLNGKKFDINRDLLRALYHLRHASAIRRLWVDAICIDQSSADDKANQIRQMDRIYRNADQVVAWLGLPLKNGHLAFDFAEKMYAVAYSISGLELGTEGELHTGNSQWLDEEQYLYIRSDFLNSSYANEWLALHWIFKRRYWARAWVFQELILAKQISFICGKKTMTWGVMELAMHLARANSDEVVDLINSSVPIPNQNTLSPVTKDDPHHFNLQYYEALLGILEGRRYRKNAVITETPAHASEILLELIQGRSCYFQHDLIYSILGLVPPSIASLMPKPSYMQPVTEVFKQFAKAFIVGAQSLNVLCYSHHSDTQDDLPTCGEGNGAWRRYTTFPATSVQGHNVNGILLLSRSTCQHFPTSELL